MAYGYDDQEQFDWMQWINSQNPEQDPAQPYVQGGTTGGYLEGVGETIGPGHSTTPGQAAAQYGAGVTKFGQSETDSFLDRNAGDTHRIDSALGGALKNGGGFMAPTQAWNAQPSGATGGSGQRDQLVALLMQRAQQGTQIARDNPNVRAQVDPAVAQQQRQSRAYLDDLAERSGPLANLQGERRLVAERGGQAAGQLEAQVIGREIDGRRKEISEALQLWGHLLSDEQRIQLERELGYLTDATRRYGIDVGDATQRYGIDTSMDQFLRDLALREYDTVNKWDYNWTNPGG